MPLNSRAVMADRYIQVGRVVTIRRSDGRSHEATITRVQRSRGITAVEWDEGNERKGKAIPFSDLLEMNSFAAEKSRSGNLADDIMRGDRLDPKSDFSSLSSDSELDDRIPIYKENIEAHQTILQSRLERNNSSAKNHFPPKNNISFTNSPIGWPSRPSKNTSSHLGLLRTSQSTAKESSTIRSKIVSPEKSVTVFRKKIEDATTSYTSLVKMASGKPTWTRRSLKTRGESRRPATQSLAQKTRCESQATTQPMKQKNEGQGRKRVVLSDAKSSVDSPKSSAVAKKVSETLLKSNLLKKNATSCDNVVKVIRDMESHRAEQRRQHADMRADKEYRKSVSKHWEIIQMIDDYRSTLDIRPFTARERHNDHKITVCIRKRPLSADELAKEEVDILTVPNEDHIVAHELKQKVDNTKYVVNQCFRFDYVFDVDCSNDFVYEYAAKPLVQTMFRGGKATCFAYGQTGSGKTHTMGGAAKNSDIGIYALAAMDVFSYLEMPQFKDLKLSVVASYYEIYGSKIFDLLEKRAPLSILEGKGGKVNVCGLSEKIVESPDDVMRLIQRGNRARTSGKTSANENSSRSHAIFQLVLQHRGMCKMYGKFSLIDLAGNERGSDNTSKEKKSQMETAQINTSLLVLKECIRAMGREGAHLPFRGSKLTHVLRDSFIGEKTKTCMIATISPGFGCCDHTIDTLRYADRVKGLPVKDQKLLRKSTIGEA